MSRQLSARSSLENLKREAKRWLNAIRENDEDARARLARVHPTPSADPTLRDVQHALALEYGFAGWSALKEEVERLRAAAMSPKDEAVQQLMRAAADGDVARVGELLDAHADIIDERAELEGHSGKRTALHFATTAPHAPVIALLLTRGANPNIRDDGDNAYPIHFLSERGHLDLVRMLVEAGADPIGDGDGHELGVIGWAVGFDYAFHRDVAEYLLANGGQHNISSAVAMGDVGAIQETVARAPADLNKPMDVTNRHRRPLHLAALKKQIASLRTLLALGADVEAEDAAQMTPLDQAAMLGESVMVDVLLAHGAKIRLPAAVALNRVADIERLIADEPHALRSRGRWEMLIVRAAERSSAEVIETLLRFGASVHVRDDHRTSIDNTHGYTPLHAAAFHGNLGAARALLRNGASPLDRDVKYLGTPAGWANYAGHAAVRDAILDHGPIDIFDAMTFDLLDRIPAILARDPEALERPFGRYMPGGAKKGPWFDAAWTPLAHAVVNGKMEAVRLLVSLGADVAVVDSEGNGLAEIAKSPEVIEALEKAGPSAPPQHDRKVVVLSEAKDLLVAQFLTAACLDWRNGGAGRVFRMHDAGRMLDANPDIARANLYTAVVCGEIDNVRRMLDADPTSVSELGGPRTWSPILYLCNARVPQKEIMDRHPEMLRLLLDRGADPVASYSGGNVDIRYTALTSVLGRGEEQALMHPHAREMAALLLERGAHPHDGQVLYNVFANHASHRYLTDDIVWLLDLMYEHSVRQGFKAMWEDPDWPQFSLYGAQSLGDGSIRHHGAHFMLLSAINGNLLGMAEWCLKHGANPNAMWGAGGKQETSTLYEQAMRRGRRAMGELLARYGAERTASLDDHGAFVMACLDMDETAVRAAVKRHPEYLERAEAMFRAIDDDRVDVVRLLLDLGMSPNVSKNRWWALHQAAGAGAEKCAQLLIDRGADVDVRNPDWDSIPLGAASFARQPKMVELFGRYSRDIWELVYNGRVDRVREVLREEPSKAHTTSSSGDTPLMWLPDDERQATELVALLVEGGADPAARNAKGVSAADVARRRGMLLVVDLLTASDRLS